MLMNVKMPTIFGILTFMSMTSLMNVLRLSIVVYAINMGRLKILLQVFYKHSNYVTA